MELGGVGNLLGGYYKTQGSLMSNLTPLAVEKQNQEDHKSCPQRYSSLCLSLYPDNTPICQE
jgi:hypothetical protein